MSRSVSAPSSETKTSPCWNGFIVPGSTLRYGSSFCMDTRSPRIFSSRPRLEAVSPLPRDDATPPVTNRCLVCTGRDWPGSGRRARAGADLGDALVTGAFGADDFAWLPAVFPAVFPALPEGVDAAKMVLPWSAMSRRKPQVHGPPG